MSDQEKIQSAIDEMEMLLDVYDTMKDVSSGYNTDRESIVLSIAALREKLQREEQPKPLTWDELRAMEGKAVYIKMLVEDKLSPSCWAIVGKTDKLRECEEINFIDAYDCERGSERKYGTAWIAYATEPKGDAKP